MKAPKLCLVLPDFGGGGAERVMVTYANAFAQRGVETTFIVGRAEGPCLADLADSVRLVDLNVPRFGKAIPALVRHFNRERPDAVLSALTHANLITLIAARLARKGPRIVVAEHNSAGMLFQGKRSLKKPMKRALIHTLYPRADKITVVSKSMNDEFAAFLSVPAGRIETIYNPVPADRLRELAAGGPHHAWLRDKRGPVVVGAGRLSPQKDFATLLRAFGTVARQSDARLIIFGEGSERAALEALRAELGLADRVDLPGFVGNLPAELSASDLFVLSSRWEGLPGVLLEALAVNTAVVATNCPTGPDEILQGGKWGRLVGVGDPAGLAAAIVETLANPPSLPSGQVLARFDPDRVVNQYLSVLLPGQNSLLAPLAAEVT